MWLGTSNSWGLSCQSRTNVFLVWRGFRKILAILASISMTLLPPVLPVLVVDSLTYVLGLNLPSSYKSSYGHKKLPDLYYKLFI